ncbi:tellurite resistance TerB family protein [Marinobacter sp. ATCH36]|uniref:tellurite resistance TerB family protein n=1 Tax=Marinobacter sp. ATCH36 TaxID=2945106 RepID=UPI002021379D|nr:tellurite resistance TerB family protein [Marinobacter sp. ATCH36]MCL7944226.1 tellurite resistance TerB family protein [Marinobacter sp. ATCH36]
MNAMKILNQLMNQASGSQSRTGGGTDVNRMVGEFASQFKGGSSKGGGSGGIDIKSLLGGGALGMMVGSKRGRKMGGTALKYGALAGVGVLAWKAYQNYQSQSSNQAAAPANQLQEGQPLEQLQGSAQEQRGLEILQAMIMAARADGHVDGEERAMLTSEIESLGPDDELHAWIQQQFNAPLDANALARSADSPQASREIYVVSVAMVDEQNPMERAWLNQLAEALKLEPPLAAELEHQVLNATR